MNCIMLIISWYWLLLYYKQDLQIKFRPFTSKCIIITVFISLHVQHSICLAQTTESDSYRKMDQKKSKIQRKTGAIKPEIERKTDQKMLKIHRKTDAIKSKIKRKTERKRLKAHRKTRWRGCSGSCFDIGHWPQFTEGKSLFPTKQLTIQNN